MIRILLAITFSLSSPVVPHTELPSTFVAGRLFAMPLVSGTSHRMVLWIDSDGTGFIRQTAVEALRLQTNPNGTSAYLPRFDTFGFPGISENHGALPILNDPAAALDPIIAPVDGQLGASWLADRIWTIDYVHQHLWLDHTAPAYHANDAVALSFDSSHRYARVTVTIAGTPYVASIDTAASVALSVQGFQAMQDTQSRVRATSFVPHAILMSWHAAHPDWQYVLSAGIGAGVSLIRVPQVVANHVTFENVWFSTRPDDDVFIGDTVQLKLGPSAFGSCAVLLDYVHNIAAFQCA